MVWWYMQRRAQNLTPVMRRNYPTVSMRADLNDSLNKMTLDAQPSYFQHPNALISFAEPIGSETFAEVYQKADHIHFLYEILFIKNLQTYPFPRRWITLIAYYHGMPEYERLIAAIRVVTEYDGNRAPEFHAEFY
uniref:Uncharacterized protein n=1 Tax=Caenorhabditis japonica TaxID=281687 RepID=A0A8R1DH39_CAEJA